MTLILNPYLTGDGSQRRWEVWNRSGQVVATFHTRQDALAAFPGIV